MSQEKKKAKKVRKPSSAKLKRHYRERERRTKAMRAKPPGTKEKLISGCMAAGFVGALVFLAAVTWTCVFAE